MAKKTNTKTSTAKGRKPSASAARSKKSTSKSASARSVSSGSATQNIENLRQKNQIKAIVLFAAAIFIGALVVIPGDHVWHWAHNVLHGFFGAWAILWPILMMYVAVITAMEKQNGKFRNKIILTAVVIVLFCSAGYIFSDLPLPKDEKLWQTIQNLYNSGVNQGGSGLVGGLLGIPFLSLMGAVGAKIAISLVLFVTLMILTGTTLIQLFKTVAKPVNVITNNIGQARERKAELPKPINIDIAIDGEDAMPAHPVTQPAAVSSRPRKNEKLEKLQKVFGFGSEHAAEKQREKDRKRAEKAAAQQQNQIKQSKELAKQAVETAMAVSTPSAAPAVKPEESTRPLAEIASKAVEASEFNKTEKPRANESVVTKKVSERETSSKIQESKTPDEIENDRYRTPPVSMLECSKRPDISAETEELQTNGNRLTQTLESFGVKAKILDICRGPSVTRYELQPAAGVKISKITNLADDIAMNLAASGVRIEAPIPGKAAVGIEVPNKNKSIVRMRELIESNNFMVAKSPLTVVLGRDITGKVSTADLGKMPHILIAGTTGSGKSVCINSLIVSLLYKSNPEDVRFLMIDPKVVELGIYNGIPQLLVPVVTDPRKAAGALGWAVTEMLDRYKTFAECNVRDLSGYNRLAKSKNYIDDDGQPMNKMPRIVIIIDELSDLMMAAPNEVEDAICRLAQMARAAGMHLVVATQRPSVDVVTGLIKANIPSRIAFAVSSAIDSRTILDTGGAEKLLGQGDMLFAPVGAQKPVRIQGCFVSDSEIESVVNFVKSCQQVGYDDKIMQEIEKNAVAEKDKDVVSADEYEDPIMSEAIKCVVETGQASTSFLQRRLRVGYARAGRLIDEMEQMGIVGPSEGPKARQVLITHQQWLEMTMQQDIPKKENAE